MPFAMKCVYLMRNTSHSDMNPTSIDQHLYSCQGTAHLVLLISPGQNGRHFGRRHSRMNESNDNKQALVQVMAWRRTGDTDSYMRH